MPNMQSTSFKHYELALLGHEAGKKALPVRIRRPIHLRQEASEAEILNASLPRFGPVHGADQPLMVEAKNKSWLHVLARSEPGSETLELYKDAIRRVETEARAAYGVEIDCESDEFVMMMITDGCFFLHLAFLILGFALEYEEDDPFFGRKQGWKKILRWVDAMFFVGNQIPLVVLKELIKKKYFQDVIEKEKEKWSKVPPFGLCNTVLFEQLIQPKLPKPTQPTSFFPGNRARKPMDSQQQPCDILHALQIILLGSTAGEKHNDENEFDLEANRYYYDEEEDNDIGNQDTPPITSEHGDQNHISTADSRIERLLDKIASKNDDSRSTRILPSVIELMQFKLHVRKLHNKGIRSIRFLNHYFLGYLYLPALQVDYTTEKIIHHLKTYEHSQPFGKHGLEISSYLQFMSDLIQTPEDVRLLKKRGVIEEHFGYAKPDMFSRICSSDSPAVTSDLRIVATKVAHFISKFRRARDFVIFLTVVQTIFAVMAYFRPDAVGPSAGIPPTN